MKNEEWLVVDTETNGLMPPVYAVEIAAQRMMGWEPFGEPFRILLNHDVPIEPMAEALHGYSRAYLREHGQNPVAAHQAFHGYAGSLPIVSYNISFDWNRVLQPEYIRLGVPCSGTRGFCAMTLARRVITETDNHKLETLKNHFRLSVGPSHKGLNDVQVVVRLFQSIFRERLETSGIRGFETVAQFSCRTPIARCLEEIQKAVGEKPVWHVQTGGNKAAGPFRVRQIVELADGNDCYVWRHGMVEWALTSQIPDFSEVAPAPKQKKPRKRKERTMPVPEPLSDYRSSVSEIKAYANELLGLCRGIVADGMLNDREIVSLQEWIAACPFTHMYPMSVIADKVEKVCEDGAVTGQEQIELIGTINEVLASQADIRRCTNNGLLTYLPTRRRVGKMERPGVGHPRAEEVSRMADILIKYRDSSGNVEERRISDIQAEGATSIDAYCHLRQARRTFKIDRVVHAVDLDTGEVINPWKFIANGLAADNRETLESLTWHVMPTVKALKFFTLTTRGSRKRELDRIVQFVQEVVDVTSYSKNEVYEWVKKLWCGHLYAYRDGNIAEYTDLLRNIPASLLKRCRDYALLIAKGSGRKPVEPSWVERIETEFSPDPRVKKQERRQDENQGISVTISVRLPGQE